MPLPDFLILGAQKAGTTSLFQYLINHKSIYAPPKKELHFFNTYKSDKTSKISIEDYIGFFEGKSKEQITGEASPSYLTSPTALKNLREMDDGKMKFIVSLRQPVDRAYSNFLHARREGIEKEKNFVSAIERDLLKENNPDSSFRNYIYKGLYARHLKAYFESFDKDRFFILLNEDLNENPRKVIKDLFDFLEIPGELELKMSRKNVGKENRFSFLRPVYKFYYRKVARSGKLNLPKGLKQILKNFLEKPTMKLDLNFRKELTIRYFEKDIKELELLIDRDLNNWIT